MNNSTTQSKRRDAANEMQAGATLLSAAIAGDEVCNLQDEKLGKIQDLMLDTTECKIRYAVPASSA